MAKEYLTYVRKFADIKEDTRKIFLKDLTPGPKKYNTRLVKAEIYFNYDEAAGMDKLWVRSETGVLDSRPKGIKILEELGEYVQGRPWSDVFASLKG
jgi:hypothetical protein